MVKKNRKRTGYSRIVASGLLLLVGVLLYGLYYVNDVRTELWDSSLSTIIENTDRASDMVAGKINAEKRSLQVQVNALESLDSTDTTPSAFCWMVSIQRSIRPRCFWDQPPIRQRTVTTRNFQKTKTQQ